VRDRGIDQGIEGEIERSEGKEIRGQDCCTHEITKAYGFRDVCKVLYSEYGRKADYIGWEGGHHPTRQA
jgi:hypothetical protein